MLQRQRPRNSKSTKPQGEFGGEQDRPRPSIIVHAAVFPPILGGAEIYSWYIARALTTSYDVTVLTRTPGESKSDKGHSDVGVMRGPAWRLPILFLKDFVKDKSPTFLWVAVPGYESILLWLFAKLKQLPTVFTYHGSYLEARNHVVKFIGKQQFLFEWIFLRLPWTVVVTVDEHSRRLLTEHFRVPVTKIVTIPSGVDLKIFRERDVGSTERRDFEGSPVILCPRRIEPKNGIHFLLNAVPRLLEQFPGLRVVIAGRVAFGCEVYASKLHGLVRNLGIGANVSFLGSVPYDEMPLLYLSADVVAVPSLAEARSLAVLEAMACGRAVVATVAGGLPELISDGRNGLLVPIENTDALCDALSRVLSDSELRARVERNARITATTNSWDLRGTSYVELFRKLIKNPVRGP